MPRNFLFIDLFDFAVLDSLMYHFDSKQYRLRNQLTVRIDHGRALVTIYPYLYFSIPPLPLPTWAPPHPAPYPSPYPSLPPYIPLPPPLPLPCPHSPCPHHCLYPAPYPSLPPLQPLSRPQTPNTILNMITHISASSASPPLSWSDSVIFL